MKPYSPTHPAPSRESLSAEAHAALDALHDWYEQELSAALGHPEFDDAPSLEHLLALVVRREPVERRPDGSRWRRIDGVMYLSPDEGLTWLRVPTCGMGGCSRPATHAEDEGVGFCEDCGTEWGVSRHHLRNQPFDSEWRRAQVAADHGGALAAAWAPAVQTGTVPDEEPLDTRWPDELRARIAQLEEQLDTARDLARRLKAGDTIEIWEWADWMDEVDNEEEVSSG